jgi:hypothetical protein
MQVFHEEVNCNRHDCDIRFKDVHILLDRVEQVEDYLQIPYVNRKRPSASLYNSRPVKSKEEIETKMRQKLKNGVY